MMDIRSMPADDSAAQSAGFGTSAPIPWARPMMFGEEEAFVLDALRSTWISGGPYVDRLEREFAQRVGARNALAVSNGTTAIELALRGLGIGPGDEVIVPGFTFVAAANVVLSLGATALYADVDRDSWLLDPGDIERLATPRTKVVMPVHLYGNVARMDAITAAADAFGITVVEDAAEAAFSCYGGRCAGTMGRVGTFSFHATKTITTGEGGMVVTDDDALAERMRILRSHGMAARRYWHDVVGYNFRLTNLQAALGCAQFLHLDEIIADRRRIHAAYQALLSDLPGAVEQRFEPAVDPVLWAMAVRLDADTELDRLRARRDAVMERMAADGIETRPGFYALNLLAPYHSPELPEASRISAGVIVLPTFVGLSHAELERICDSLRTHLRETL
jgi:perosamine synthetase